MLRAHRGNTGNDRADKLADLGRKGLDVEGNATEDAESEMPASDQELEMVVPLDCMIDLKERDELRALKKGEVARILRATTNLGIIDLPPRIKGYNIEELRMAAEETEGYIKAD